MFASSATTCDPPAAEPIGLAGRHGRIRDAEGQVLHDVGQEQPGERPAEIERDADADAGELAAANVAIAKPIAPISTIPSQPRANRSGSRPMAAGIGPSGRRDPGEGSRRPLGVASAHC